MMKKDYKDIDSYITDAVIGRQYGFIVGNQFFNLYPLTLGKMYITKNLVEELDINKGNIAKDISYEALRLAKEKKDICLTIISYHTCKTKEEVFNSKLINERIELFKRELSEEDIASMMLIVLSADKTNMIIQHLGIDKEQDRLSAVMRIKAKGDKNNLSFGGKSIFGTMIDSACERYGWTKDYVVWGIDLPSLRLMLADKVNSVYCTDEEIKKIPKKIRQPQADVIKADKETMKQIKSMDWS